MTAYGAMQVQRLKRDRVNEQSRTNIPVTKASKHAMWTRWFVGDGIGSIGCTAAAASTVLHKARDELDPTKG